MLRSVSTRTCLVLALALAAPLTTITHAQMAPTSRTLTGVVEDKGHEPLRGAVVELQNPLNNSVESYIADASGHYTFKRLDGNTDYRLWATFRGHKSAIHSISKFDSHMAKSIDLICTTH